MQWKHQDQEKGPDQETKQEKTELTEEDTEKADNKDWRWRKEQERQGVRKGKNLPHHV
jgi:hypothetical protein